MHNMDYCVIRCTESMFYGHLSSCKVQLYHYHGTIQQFYGPSCTLYTDQCVWSANVRFNIYVYHAYMWSMVI